MGNVGCDIWEKWVRWAKKKHLDVVLDLGGRLEPEELEVAHQVVGEREELQVELGEREALLGVVRVVGDHSRVPWRRLVRVERQLADGLVLRRAKKHEKRELISDIWGKRGTTYGEKGVCRRIKKTCAISLSITSGWV